MSAYTVVTGHQPDLQKMTRGQPVLEAQQLLDKHCFGPVPDGYFGDETERCLNEFKAAYGMTTDGLIDQATWGVLNAPPRMIFRLWGKPTRHANVVNWQVNNGGCPTIPAWTVISQSWAFDRNNITNVTPATDFATTSDQPIGTQEPFALDLLTFFTTDGQYSVVVAAGPDLETLDYDIVQGQVI